MLLLRLRKTGVVENQPGAVALGLELEPGDRVDAGLPVADPPGLDEPLVRHQLEVPSRDHAAETRKGTAGFSRDLGGGSAGHLAELLGVRERLVDALGAGVDDDFLMNRTGHRAALLRLETKSVPILRLFSSLSSTPAGNRSGLPAPDLAVGRSSDDELMALRPGAEEGLKQGAHALEPGRVETLRIFLRPPEADGGDVVRIRVRDQDDLVDEASPVSAPDPDRGMPARADQSP